MRIYDLAYIFLFLLLFLFVITTSIWIFEYSIELAIVGILFSSFVINLPLLIYLIIKYFLPNITLFIFPFLVVGCEYIQLHNAYFIPYNLLGNYLGFYPRIIQWYEYTGVLGGTFWISLIFATLISYLKAKHNYMLIFLILVTIIPIFISDRIYRNIISNDQSQVKFICIQPNILNNRDVPESDVIKLLISKIEELDINKYSILILPETIFDNVDVTNLVDNQFINKFIELQSKCKLLMGIGILDKNYLKYPDRVIIKKSYFNGMLFLSISDSARIYYKNKLIPFVEYTPKISKGIDKYLARLFAIDNSLEFRENKNTVFTYNDSLEIIPKICYESLFGEEISSQNIHKKSFIVVTTNENLYYSNFPSVYLNTILSIRAIEYRNFIIKCGNNSSSLIDSKGELICSTIPFTSTILTGAVSGYKSNTIYKRYGDYLGAFALSVIIFYFTFCLIKMNF